MDIYADQFDYYDIDILFIQDTGEKRQEVTPYPLRIRNITLFYRPPPNKDKAGGLAVLVKETFSPFFAPLPIPKDRHNRIWSFEIIQPFSIVIHMCYQKANNKEITKQLLSIDKVGKALILGDLNSVFDKQMDACATAAKIVRNKSPVTDLIKEGWIDCYRNCNPTTVAFSRSGTYLKNDTVQYTASRIDHILASKDVIGGVVNCDILEENLFDSDHRLVYIDLQEASVPKGKRVAREIQIRKGLKDKGKWKTFNEELTREKQANSEGKSIDEKANDFTNALKVKYDKIFPLEKVTIGKVDNWMRGQPEYRIYKKAKRAAFKIIRYVRVVLGGNATLSINRLKQLIDDVKPCLVPIPCTFGRETVIAAHLNENLLANKMRGCIRKQKKETMTKRMEKIIAQVDKDGHNAYKLVRDRQDKEIKCIIDDVNKKILTQPMDIENALNQEWKEIFTAHKSENEGLNKFLENQPIPESEPPEPDFSVENIESILQGKAPTSPGQSDTTWVMLKNTPKSHLAKLSDIFTTCYKQNICPTQWKQGITVLIPKPDTPPTPAGFRPITLLSVEYKLYTHILNSCLIKWLLDNNALPEAQNGGLPDRGCDTCLWAILTMLKEVKDTNHPIHLIFIDFSKAFDSVEHWALQKIMEHLKAGKLGENIIELLRGSSTSLKINGVISQEKINLNRGTKQGDVISPLLFILFLSPLLWTIDKKCKGVTGRATKFKTAAIIDDIAFASDSKDDAEKGLNFIKEFSEVTGIDINPKKSAYAFRNVGTPLFPSHKGIPFAVLGADKSYRYLGIWINLDLNWQTQWEKTKDSLWKGLNLITSKFYLPAAHIANLVNAIVYSKIGYRMQVILFPAKWIDDVELEVERRLRDTGRYGWHMTIQSWQLCRGLKSLSALNIERYLGSLTRNMIRTNQNIAYNNIRAYLSQKYRSSEKMGDIGWVSPRWALDRLKLDWIDAKTTCKYEDFRWLPNLPNFSPYSSPPDKLKVWTDGSLMRVGEKYYMGAGVVTNTRMEALSFKVNGNPSSLEPELQAILATLQKYKNSTEIAVYTDSLASIKVMKKIKLALTQSFLGAKNAATVRAIKDQAKDRYIQIEQTLGPAAKERAISFHHVHSHGDTNKRKRIRNEEKYGKQAGYIAEGNRRADEAAEKGRGLNPSTQISVADPFAIPFRIFPKSAPLEGFCESVESTTREWSCRKWEDREPTKAKRFFQQDVDSIASTAILRTKLTYQTAASNFALKLMTATLPTKPTVARTKWLDNSKIPEWKKNAYRQPNCANCKGDEEETHEHLFHTCPHAIEEHKKLCKTILTNINLKLGTAYGSLPWWFTKNKQDWKGEERIKQEFEKMPKDLGWRGFIPKALYSLLRSHGSEEKVAKVLEETSWQIAKCNYEIWKNRNKNMFEKPKKTKG